MRKTVHVVPKDGNWAVKSGNSIKVSKVTKTQKEAIQQGQDQAKRNGSELLIHGKNGRIREKNSFGKDHFPPKG